MGRDTVPYSVLARGYDAVMAHVDYEGWVAYIDELLHLSGGSPRKVIELGCGTGTFASIFQSLHDVSYLATDRSEEMLRVATAKQSEYGTSVRFKQADFTALRVPERFDLALLLYDGLNYLTELDRIAELFRAVEGILEPGGRFIFDQATPANSINNQTFFEDTGTCEAFDYVRRSAYDPDTGLHETVFELDTPGAQYTERHIQRPYRFSEIRDILSDGPFEIVAAYADFLLKQVDSGAERIHWVVRKPRLDAGQDPR